MRTRYHYTVMSIVVITVFSWCICRDVQIEKGYTSDLRNRVVGARLQMDGKLPYFYYWHPADGLRYYDPDRFDTTYTNQITATPFFHHLLYPIANFPQRLISRIWLAAEYVMYITLLAFAWSFAGNWRQQWAVIVISCLFLFTGGWHMHIFDGQMYLVIPFLAMGILFFLRRCTNLLTAAVAGLLSVALLLVKPTTLVFFLPFLLAWKQYSARFLSFFFLPVILLTGYSVLNKNERSYWLDYRKAIAAHIQDHQSGDMGARTLAFQPVLYHQWEGWDRDSIRAAKKQSISHLRLENAGVQQVIQKVFHRKIPYQTLEWLCVAWLVGIAGLFYWKYKNGAAIDIDVLALFGFCLYMTVDFFSPIPRIQYYTVQWIFPLLVVAADYHRRTRMVYFLLLAGVILNILNAPLLKMPHTAGEYLILLTLFYMCICNNAQSVKPTPK